jgi:hypothetical protein
VLGTGLALSHSAPGPPARKHVSGSASWRLPNPKASRVTTWKWSGRRPRARRVVACCGWHRDGYRRLFVSCSVWRRLLLGEIVYSLYVSTTFLGLLGVTASLSMLKGEEKRKKSCPVRIVICDRVRMQSKQTGDCSARIARLPVKSGTTLCVSTSV